ncbi:hypothetical protein MTO96_006515 [Rhipicephalus appendiculatus]
MGSSRNPTAQEARTGPGPERGTGHESDRPAERSRAGVTGRAAVSGTTETGAARGTATTRIVTGTRRGSTGAATELACVYHKKGITLWSKCIFVFPGSHTNIALFSVWLYCKVSLNKKQNDTACSDSANSDDDAVSATSGSDDDVESAPSGAMMPAATDAVVPSIGSQLGIYVHRVLERPKDMPSDHPDKAHDWSRWPTIPPKANPDRQRHAVVPTRLPHIKHVNSSEFGPIVELQINMHGRRVFLSLLLEVSRVGSRC